MRSSRPGDKGKGQRLSFGFFFVVTAVAGSKPCPGAGRREKEKGKLPGKKKKKTEARLQGHWPQLKLAIRPCPLGSGLDPRIGDWALLTFPADCV